MMRAFGEYTGEISLTLKNKNRLIQKKKWELQISYCAFLFVPWF